jgi:hypothetical protein
MKRSGAMFRQVGWLLCFLAAVITSNSKGAIFSTIVTNGPTTNRINLVFFSEGYTNGQLSAFLNDATNVASLFLNAEPYAEYSNYFNVFAIFTNSAHLGSTHLISRAYSPGYTYFNSTYDVSNDRLITIPPNTSDASSSHGQGKINALLWTNYASIFRNTNNTLSALLVNDPVFGGSADGGSADYGKLAISSIGEASDIFVHETGHTLGKLGDEYTTSYPGYSTTDVEPNTTTNTVYSKIKWNAWISTNTPLPTPFTIPYADTVGLFEGAHYHTTNWYRPYENCCMQSPGVGFCPVCQEALVLAIYGKARPVDSHSPATNSLTVTNAQLLLFSVNLLQPATHSLNVQWLTNGVAVDDATNFTFYIWPGQLGNGTRKVEADVWDATDLVRNDAKNALKQTNQWTLTVAVPVMQIDSLTWLTNGGFSFRVTGSAPAGVVIQMSTNLMQWTPVQTGSFSSGKLFYTNAGAKSIPQRFFRTATP